MWYNYVSFNEIHHKRKKLDYVITLITLIYFIPAYAGIMYFYSRIYAGKK